MSDSKLVAEFLGWKSNSETSFSKDDKVAFSNHFEFAKNNNWNDLMILVEKCFHIEADENSNILGDISCGLLNTDITETYEACVEAIKYLNRRNNG